jgi:hypothetical protein
MLIEIWERLRGYDKWVRTDAVVCRSGTEKVENQGRYGTYYTTEAGDVIEWTDPTGEKQYADFNAPEGSKLFQLVAGDKVEIRYNPAKPDDFYYRDLLRMKVRQGAVATFTVVLFLAISALEFLGRVSQHRH